VAWCAFVAFFTERADRRKGRREKGRTFAVEAVEIRAAFRRDRTGAGKRENIAFK
jgi:hypothetical protein